MILDKRTEIADAVALNTGAAGTYLIGSQIDLSKARDIGQGRPLYLVIQVDTEVDSAGDGVTLQFKLASDDSASVSTTTSTVHVVTPVLTQAQLVAGFAMVIPIPPEPNVYEQFLGLLQVTAVEAVTAGKINAFLTPDLHGWKAYPNAVGA